MDRTTELAAICLLFLSAAAAVVYGAARISVELPPLQAVVSRQHNKVLADMLAFARRAQKQLESLHAGTLSKDGPHSPGLPRKYLPPRLEIPTAALVAGAC